MSLGNRPSWLVAYLATVTMVAAVVLGVTGVLNSEAVAAIIGGGSGLAGGFVAAKTNSS